MIRPILLTREVKARCAGGCESQVHTDLPGTVILIDGLYCELCGGEKALEIALDPGSEIHSRNMAEAALHYLRIRRRIGS